MGFIAHYRGAFREYAAEFHESMLLQEVTLEGFLAERYPPFLLENYPDQARTDREKGRDEILAAILPGDTLWLWRHTDSTHRTDESMSEWGGLAVRRERKVIRVWLVWEDQ